MDKRLYLWKDGARGILSQAKNIFKKGGADRGINLGRIGASAGILEWGIRYR